MTNEEYRKAEGVARSDLFVLFSQTPLHMKYRLDNPNEEDTPALLEGRAAHKMILEPSTFNDEFVVAPICDRRTKEGKEIYARFAEEAKGKSIITQEIMDKVKAMRDALREFRQAAPIFQGEVEQSFFWTDAETGEKCKVRPDCLTEVDGKKFIIDYKTTDSCADGHFERSVRKYGYKFQAGMYREGVFQSTYEDYGFAFIAQEKKAPFAARVYVCDEMFINEGFDQFRQALNTYHWCKEHELWYGYEGAEDIITNLVGEGDI